MTRTLLTVVVVAAMLLVLAAMAWGWRRRGARQDVLLPGLDTEPRADLGEVVVGPHEGLYVGTTFATSWQDRVVAGGLGRRAAATATLYRAGAVFERQGDTPVFLATERLGGARVEPALAGKVLGRGGLLVLRWHAGDHELDTGFRADDRAAYLEWITALDYGGGPGSADPVDPDVPVPGGVAVDPAVPTDTTPQERAS